MGFFRRLFGRKRPTTSPPASNKDKKNKNKNKSKAPDNPDTPPSDHPYSGAALDANKHAIAVAAATAAVAEAALAAAHAAAEVVRLTNSGAAGSSAQATRNRHAAAVKIQSAFRGYLARRALRALKALVKLQALVRGHIVRKQTADMLKRMQTLVRVQARVRAGRTQVSEALSSSSKSSQPKHSVPENPDKNGHQQRAYSSKYDGPSILKRCGSNSNFRDAVNLDKTRMGSNWLDRWMEESVWNNCQGTSRRYAPGHADDEKNDKILEVDTWKPHLDTQRSTRSFQMPRHVFASDNQNRSLAMFDSPSKRSMKPPNVAPNLSSIDAMSLSHLKYPIEKGEAAMRTAGNSPQAFSASSRPGSSSGRRGPFTPAKSERAWGYFSGYASYPNYMANTESSRAKLRSQSAPRQRLDQFEKYGTTKRSDQGYWDGWTHSSMNTIQDANLQGSAYPSYNHMDKFGSASLR